MNLRWLLGNFTDPQYKLSRRDQHRLSMAAHKKYLSWRRFWGYSLVVMAVPFGLVFAFGIPAVLDWLGLTRRTPAHTWAFAGVSLLTWPYCAWAYRTLYIKPIRRAMRDHGYDLCVSCGYELRGLGYDVKRCPECGSWREVMPEKATTDGHRPTGIVRDAD